jgi:hypothetical protein
MNEVTKAEFREAFLKYGSAEDGWGQGYWDRFFAVDKSPPMKFMFQPPESTRHSRMMIVNDFLSREYRMFFLTLDEEEGLFAR